MWIAWWPDGEVTVLHDTLKALYFVSWVVESLRRFKKREIVYFCFFTYKKV